MKTVMIFIAVGCAFLAFTFAGFNVWCWLFSFWQAAPEWLAAPNYWAFTACWMLMAFLTLGIFGLNGTDQDAH